MAEGTRNQTALRPEPAAPRGTAEPGGAETVTAIRMTEESYLKGNHKVLHVRAGAVLQVQYDRSDRGYDVGHEAALYLLQTGHAEMVEGTGTLSEEEALR